MKNTWVLGSIHPGWVWLIDEDKGTGEIMRADDPRVEESLAEPAELSEWLENTLRECLKPRRRRSSFPLAWQLKRWTLDDDKFE